MTNVLESMKRISDAKYGTVTAYANSVPNGAALNTAALGTSGIQACGYTKAAYMVDTYSDPGSVNPALDPLVVGPSGIFSAAEFQASSDYQKTASIMKLVIDGNAAAGTIEMDGFDYHTGDRATGEARDLNLGNCIGACLEYAARKGKPLMIYVFSDGSLASSGMIDSSAGGRGKGVWTADNQNVAATYFLVYNPTGRPVPAQSNPELSLQIGNFNPDGSQNTTGSPAGNNVPNLAQMVVLNYMALHGRTRSPSGRRCTRTRHDRPELGQYPGHRHCARTVDRFQSDCEHGLNGNDPAVGSDCLNPEASIAVCAAAYIDARCTVRAAAYALSAPLTDAAKLCLCAIRYARRRARSYTRRCARRYARTNFHECAPCHTQIGQSSRLPR